MAQCRLRRAPASGVFPRRRFGATVAAAAPMRAHPCPSPRGACMHISPLLAAVAVAAAALFTGTAAAQARSAVAELKPLGTSGASGRVEFEAQGGKVNVRAQVSGLAPNAELG